MSKIITDDQIFASLQKTGRNPQFRKHMKVDVLGKVRHFNVYDISVFLTVTCANYSSLCTNYKQNSNSWSSECNELAN